MDKKWTAIQKDGYWLIENEGGATLGAASMEHILTVDGFAFKDLNRNGVLDPYEDWRLPAEQRVADLAGRLAVEDIAGLMLYSIHQALTTDDFMTKMRFPGQEEDMTPAHPYELSGFQKRFLERDRLRHVLLAVVDSAEVAAKWNNNAQAFVEGLGFGIPINTSSDPRHTKGISAEFSMGGGGVSIWPETIGLAAAFDPELVRLYADVVAKEYRAMGIATALSPQIDLATDPRWFRFFGTFGESPRLSTDLARAFCDGLQTSYQNEISDGWGYQSVNAMVKHWPGGGSGEAGRDAHFEYGKYAVYPGDNFEGMLAPFTEGAFALEDGTKQAAAVMPYYTISHGQDTAHGEEVGNAYSKYIIGDLLRGEYGYDGVVCTDWLVTGDRGPVDSFMGGKCWGVEDLTVAQRHYKILMAGVDQFGGNNDIAPVLEAYAMGCAEHGEEWMRARFERSARRLLCNIFRPGLFENPYLDVAESEAAVGSPAHMDMGFAAQLRTVVMLKNKGGVLPLAKKAKVYVPTRHLLATTNWFGMEQPERDVTPADLAVLARYFEVVPTPEEADCAFCFIESPAGKEYSAEDGCVPLSLQYRPYTANAARETPLAMNEGEDPGFRSLRGKTGHVSNERDLDMVLDARRAMGTKPVVVFINAKNPMVMAELDAAADAVLMHFNVQDAALMELACGQAAPSALLPFQMPKDMDTVEAQNEDCPFDMTPFTDECGGCYDFGFGLDWQGVIQDDRLEKYHR